MSVAAAASRLTQATKELALEWERTRAHWQDVKSREFEKDYLEELPHHVTRALGAIEEINTVLGKVKRDCE